MSHPTTTPQQLGAELLGTLVLVLLGCGTLVLVDARGDDYLAAPLAFGLALLLAVQLVGRVSGAHLNPAVSVGAALAGRFAWRRVPAYVGAQVVGGTLGAGLLWLVLQALPRDSSLEGQVGQSFLPEGFAWWGALLLEVVLTAVLVLAVLAADDARSTSAASTPLLTGLSLTAVYLVAVPLTGGGANPARSLGPALFSGTDALADLWLFVVGPLLGAAVAGLAHPALLGHDREPVPGSGLALGRPGGAHTSPARTPAHADQQLDPATGTHAAVRVEEAQPAWGTEPIIQDGWQWDHQAQEWKPLEQWGTDPGATATPGQAGRAGEVEDRSDYTQIRPPRDA